MLIEYVPQYYKNSKVFNELLKCLSKETEMTRQAAESLKGQMFVDTATWGLDIWEKEFDVIRDESSDYEERRGEIIKAKMQGVGTCTVDMIKKIAKAYTGAEVEVTEYSDRYIFAVKFLTKKGEPKGIKAFRSNLDVVKPAHLAYELELTYTIWKETKRLTWGEMKETTWEELKVREID